MLSICSGVSAGRLDGMRRPYSASNAVGKVSLLTKKLASGSPGMTRTRPACAAENWVAGTLTSWSWDWPSKSTKPPCGAIVPWQATLMQLALKIVD